jgi:class 3 adenylate cyclase
MAEQEARRPLADITAPEAFRLALPFGTLAFIGAIGSLLTCYGSIVAAAILGIEPYGINPHLQAVVMWGLGLLAIFALWRDRRRHEQVLPLAMGAAGVALLVFLLYVHYDTRFEILAYVLLLVAALLNQNAMVTRLYRTVRQQAHEIGDLNRNLEDRVQRQVHEIERLGRLKDFLAPPVAELVIAEGKDALLESHRRYIACLFCDIRNFTSLSESVEPEEAISLLQTFHERLGILIAERQGTIGYRAGDGLMVFFNDPLTCDQPVLNAVELAVEMRDGLEDLLQRWQRLGHQIGIGIGIASGYATLGMMGGHGRADYTAIGNVVNIASRLCDQAKGGEILIDQRAYLEVEDQIEAEPCGQRALKGVGNPIETYRVVGLKSGDRGSIRPVTLPAGAC